WTLLPSGLTCRAIPQRVSSRVVRCVPSPLAAAAALPGRAGVLGAALAGAFAAGARTVPVLEAVAGLTAAAMETGVGSYSGGSSSRVNSLSTRPEGQRTSIRKFR